MRAAQLLAGLCWLRHLIEFDVRAEISLPTDPYYIGGVVEFPALPVSYEPSDIHDRIRQFRQLIETAVIRPDIIVFPENVLNNRTYPVIVPPPQASIVPCGPAAAYDYIITEISCYARSLQVYLLINVVEREHCTAASNSGAAGAQQRSACPIYNTNVVFDRGGAVVSRYRKYNLIGAEWQYYNYTSQPERDATFRTDFNVTFGHFTRMDLLYYRPAQALVEQGIADFLHPSKWQSELPFMTAMQLHQSWAYSNDVNLLVAGTNDPRHGRTGSGIYAGRHGALIAAMTSEQQRRKLHVSVLPKKGHKPQLPTQQQQQQHTVMQYTERFTGVKLARDNDIDLFTTYPLSAADGAVVQRQVCHSDLCCDFHIERHVNNSTTPTTATATEGGAASNNVSYYYRLAAFKGLGRFLNTEPDAMAVCALFACVGDHLYSCARIHSEGVAVENRYTFDALRIGGRFPQRAKQLIMPTSVDGMLMPLPVQAFAWQVQQLGNVSVVNYTLLQPKANLLTFGIYVNYFVDETIYDQHHNNNNAKQNMCKKELLVFLLFVLALRRFQIIYKMFT